MYGRFFAIKRFSFQPVVAIIKSKTLTIAVPMVFTGRVINPAIWSATTRP
ncbi:unannotated protein [freshwater metagenome]|uniref:Unannotated protein n=1 Tax=freshwater metagenome TaxID=449393 RepID=A0A6J7NKT4_9ZZZZ